MTTRTPSARARGLIALALGFCVAAVALAGNPAATPIERKDKQARKRHEEILARIKKGDVDLVFLGDSITDGWGGDGRTSTGTAVYKARWAPLKAANLGVGADATSHALWRITKGGELKGISPKLVVLMIGINNVANGNKPEQIAEGHAALIKAIQANSADTKVLLLGTFPAGKEPTHKWRAAVKAINALLAKQADGDRVRFLDIGDKFLDASGKLTNAFGSDHIHLTAKGYTVWADAIEPTVKAMLSGGPAPKPTPGKGKRTRWVHAEGDVVKKGKGAWVERQKTGEFHFVEKSATAEFVELFDKSRGYTVRLTDDAMLIKGGKGDLPTFDDFTKIRDGKWADGGSAPVTPTGSTELGKLSEKYESSGRGPGTVSSGVGDPGGVSYGTYQLSSKMGRADAFVKKFYPKEFAGVRAGTSEFTAKWKDLAKKDAAGLHRNEHAYIKETHYDVQAAKVLRTLKLDVNTRHKVIRDVVWSVAVQHGPNASVIVNALKGKDVAAMSDADLVNAIYDERSRKRSDGKLVYAPGLDAKWTAGLAGRFAAEKRDALAMLGGT
jgi:beta-glucosidase